MNVTFDAMLSQLNIRDRRGDTGGMVRDVTDDSRRAATGTLFFAIRGVARDGHDFVKTLPAGSAAVVERFIAGATVPQLLVPSTRDAFITALSAFHGLDLSALSFTGITGTNGKTTFTYLMERIFAAAGKTAGIVGTINYRCGGLTVEATHTTPDVKTLVPLFRQFYDAGCRDIVAEVSSHALSQDRIKGIRFDGAVFSNLTPEHLDFHKDMEDYYYAKKLLFTEYLKPGGFAVINVDDSYGDRLYNELAGVTKAGFSFEGQADFRCTVIESGKEITEIGIVGREFSDIIRTELKGRFNAYNVVSAYLAGRYAGIGTEALRAGILDLKRVPGRIEEVKNTLGFRVFVDYAHTPDALSNILRTAKEMTKGRLITVFGCGGDRDRTKRPVMGRIASLLSDIIVVTSDNPRTEDPEAIINDIKPGLDFSRKVLIQPRRDKAIYDAVYSAKKGDTIIIAGKGHEEYQIVGTVKTHFSDREVAEEALKKRACLEQQLN